MLAFVLCCHEYDCGILLSSTLFSRKVLTKVTVTVEVGLA